MSTTTLIKPPTSAVHDLPAFGEMLAELLSLIFVVVVAGPPVVLLAGPLVIGALMLAGPFALAATGVLVVVLALIALAALVALARAVVATPSLLVRRYRGLRGRRAHRGAPAEQLVVVESRHGVA
jgi:membrane protein implicated in regulation of membrane protease activity